MSSHLLDSTCGHERLPLLVLLRAGLWEREPDDISCFRSPSFSWESLFRLARQQTVTGLVFNGLQYLPDSLLPPEPMLIRWAAESDAIERRNIHMNKCLDELYSFFRKRGLNPILQKGQGTARFYERPLLRECGDIDFYFNNVRAWDFAHTYIRRLKINVRRQPDRSLFYSWRGVTVEHHKRLFDVYNPFLQDFLNRLEHENGCLAPVDAVESEGDGHDVADKGEPGEEGQQAAVAGYVVLVFFDGLALDLAVAFEPFPLAGASEPVGGEAAQPVADRGDRHGNVGIGADGQQSHEEHVRAHGQDGGGQKGPNEESDVTVFDQKFHGWQAGGGRRPSVDVQR